MMQRMDGGTGTVLPRPVAVPGGVARAVTPPPETLRHGLQRIDLDGASRAQPFLHAARDIAFHWHREMEVLLVLKGTARIIVEGRICDMREGDIMIVNADETHSSLALSLDTVICGVHIDVAHYQRLGLIGFAERAYRCKSFLHGKSFQELVLPIKAFMARMILTDTRRPEDSVIRSTMAMALCCYIHRFIASEPGDRHDSAARGHGRDRILRIIDVLTQSDRAPSLSVLADEEGVTLSHLSRLFRSHTGVSFRDYAQNAKLDAVVEDLLTTDETVSNIILSRGIGNPSLFYNRFRERFGCSPTALRGRAQAALTPSDLPESVERSAMAELHGYLEHLGPASERIFGLKSRDRHVAIAAPHQPPAWNPSA